MSNIIILTGSMRKNGNTALLAQRFADGAAVNNNVDIVSVADYKVNPRFALYLHFKRIYDILYLIFYRMP